jgi:hypothetical protein
MIEAGLWRDRKQRRKLGECKATAASIGGFEDRGPQCMLLVFIDARPVR